MTPRVRVGLAALVSLLAVVLGGTGCAASGHATSAGTDRVMTFTLDSDRAGDVKVAVAGKPTATVPTSTEDMDFELYTVKRSDGVVLVTFALHNTGTSEINLAYASQDLDENAAASVRVASAITLVDTKGLKEYKTFREDGDEGSCLCSQTWNAIGGNDFGPGTRRYFVAEVAAPPAEVTSVTLRAGIATVPGVEIED